MSTRQQTAFSRRRFCGLLAALPVAGWPADAAHAHTADEPPAAAPPLVTPSPVAEEEPPPKPVFDQLFPHPTGENGYEDVVRAADFITGLPDASGRDATLTQKRALLSTPQAQQTLALLRIGLNRQVIQSPFTSYSPETLFPHFARFRALARLLSVEQYVLLADGKTAQAVDNLFDGLRLGNISKGEVLIGGLVGVAVDAIVTSTLAKRLDMLSARDCDRLAGGVRQYLVQPDRTIDAFETENKYFATGYLMTWLRNPAAFAQDLTPEAEEDQTTDPELATVMTEMRKIGTNKAAREALADAVQRRSETGITQAIASLRDPSSPPPKPPTGAERATLAYRLAQETMPIYTQAASKFQTIRAQTQLLGVHGAIRRFRWECNRLPETLAELPRVGDLIRDPFTGQSLVYKKTGDATFELASAGPLPRDDNGYYIVGGKRTPVTVPTAPRPAQAP